jgi:glucosyl-3-phosphoglycerate synthase
MIRENKEAAHSRETGQSKPNRRRRSERPKGTTTVVIPALNEARTIASVVRFALKDPEVAEVIVIDDGSVDGTPELAREAGARVVTSSLLGKGASMEEGVEAARHEYIVYLDGDLRGLKGGMISRLVEPLKSGSAEFVKARFSRAAGRVTMLTARPLIRLYFPELSELAQPLGGIVAARTDLLRRLRFENDYGVDIALVIDVLREKGRIVEVDIGRIRHDSQPLEKLSEMAGQVVRVILERAAEWGRLRVSFMRERREQERHRAATHPQGLRMLNGAQKLAMIDMDGTLLDGRFVLALAAATDRTERILPLLDNASLDPVRRTRRIAAVFKGVRRDVFEKVAREIPLMPGAAELVVGLRKRGYVVGIVTDSYRLAAETVRRRVFADFSVSHVMKFRGDKASGSITLSPFMLHPDGCPDHRLCKRNVLAHLLEETGLKVNDVLAVGDGENDRCMLEAAGQSVAFRPKSEEVGESARRIAMKDLQEVLDAVR